MAALSGIHQGRILHAVALFMIICLIPFAGFGHKPTQEETIYWSADHRLQFSDFRGQPVRQSVTNKSRRGEGGIAGAIIKSIVADTRKKNGRIYFVVYASMKPSLSTISKAGDSTALRHEQGHFDICEIYARRLRQEIGTAVSVDQARQMWNKILEAEEQEQTRYDKTNTYRSGGITRAWYLKIGRELKSLDAFADPEVPAEKIN